MLVLDFNMLVALEPRSRAPNKTCVAWVSVSVLMSGASAGLEVK